MEPLITSALSTTEALSIIGGILIIIVASIMIAAHNLTKDDKDETL